MHINPTQRRIEELTGRPIPGAGGHGTAMRLQAKWAAEAVTLGMPRETARQWIVTDVGPQSHPGYERALDEFERLTESHC